MHQKVQNLLSSRLLSKNLKIGIYKAIILPVVFLGCETWSLTLRKEPTPSVFENWVLRRIFGLKRDEVVGGWRKLHNEELYNLYSLPSIIRIIKSRRMSLVGHVARMGMKRNAYKILMGKPEGKRPLGRSRRRWEDNIKKDLREIGSGGMDWIHLAQDMNWWRALVNMVMNLWVAKNFGKLLSNCTTGGFSRRAQLHGVSLVSYLHRNVHKAVYLKPHVSKFPAQV
jgi:hypothetical protein